MTGPVRLRKGSGLGGSGLTGRRVNEAALAALAPVLACLLALGALTAWVGSGRAGRAEPRITVSYGQVLLPYGATTETAAFFSVSNAGTADDRLLGVTSPALPGQEMSLSRHSMTDSGRAAYKQDENSTPVPAGTRLVMTGEGLDVILHAGPGWRVGDLVPFTLRFERSGTVRAVAVVTRPGGTLSA